MFGSLSKEMLRGTAIGFCYRVDVHAEARCEHFGKSDEGVFWRASLFEQPGDGCEVRLLVFPGDIKLKSADNRFHLQRFSLRAEFRCASPRECRRSDVSRSFG